MIHGCHGNMWCKMYLCKVLGRQGTPTGYLLPHTYKFSRDFIFVNFMNQRVIAKIKT